MRGVANAKDIRAIPNSGMARLPRFRLGLCFVRDIPTFSNTLDPNNFDERTAKISRCKNGASVYHYALS